MCFGYEEKKTKKKKKDIIKILITDHFLLRETHQLFIYIIVGKFKGI